MDTCRTIFRSSLLIMLVWACMGAESSAASNRSVRWFDQAPGTPVKGVALVVHGLNLEPDRLLNLIRVLNAGGVRALRVSLQGHGDNFMPIKDLDKTEARLESFKTVSYQIWSQEFLQAYRRIQKFAQERAVPLYLIGDSFGALLALELFLNETEVKFDRMVLYAPALSLHGRNAIIQLLNPFPKLVLPSFAPHFYRANRGTPQLAYAVVFETLARFEKSIGPKINIPTLVFIDPKDELISYKGLRKLIQTHQLDRWRIQHVSKDKDTAATRINHLIIDPASVGQSTWKRMVKAMQSHLLRPQTF